MSINRVVALLTPLVFAPLAGTCAAWLAEHFPGVEIRADQLQQVFIAGAVIALAPALQWLHGWQKHEARIAGWDHAARASAAAPVPEPAPAAHGSAPGEGALPAFTDEELGLGADDALAFGPDPEGDPAALGPDRDGAPGANGFPVGSEV